MKIIFLDIDGVLNNDHTKERFEHLVFVSDNKISLLKELIDKTGAKVVLSSTWRRGWECKERVPNPTSSDLADIRLFEALRTKLKEYDIELMSYTEDFGFRGEEIDLWLKQWAGEPIEAYVILDDMDGTEIFPHAQHLVQTGFWEGLEQKHIEKAIKILSNKESGCCEKNT